jgi:DGQHR domain-containing protein
MPVNKLSRREQLEALERLSSFIPEEQRLMLLDLGQDDNLSLKDKIQTTFLELSDPLLSVSDLGILFGTTASELKDIETILSELVSEEFLESDDRTFRPLMPKGNEDMPVERLYRLKGVEPTILKILALETEIFRKDNSELVDRYYQFSCNARLLRQIARIDRFDAILGTGQQREEVKNHIKAIKEGMESGKQVPNSVLLVFDIDKTIHSASGEIEEGDKPGPEKGFISRSGDSIFETYNPQEETDPPVQKIATVQISIPYRKAAFDREKIISIADGQQRTAALGLASIDKVPTYVMTVNAVLPADSDTATLIFSIANNSKPIKSDFRKIIDTTLQDADKLFVSSSVARKLANTETSPFYQLVEMPGYKTTQTVVRFNTLENSIGEFVKKFKGSAVEIDADTLETISSRFFNLVKATWPEAWGLKPQESKLMAGVGLRSLTTLFASVLQKAVLMENQSFDDPQLWKRIEKDLKTMRDYCVVWRQEDALANSALHVNFYASQIKPRSLTFQDLESMEQALDLAKSEQWKHNS